MSSGIAAAAAGAEAIAPAMFKSTVEITQTLLACEDKNDKRHRDLLAVEERKLHIEEAKTEISQSWSGRPHHCRQQPCFRHPRTCWWQICCRRYIFIAPTKSQQTPISFLQKTYTSHTHTHTHTHTFGESANLETWSAYNHHHHHHHHLLLICGKIFLLVAVPLNRLQKCVAQMANIAISSLKRGHLQSLSTCYHKGKVWFLLSPPKTKLGFVSFPFTKIFSFFPISVLLRGFSQDC